MVLTADNEVLIVFIVYILVILAIGIRAGSITKNLSDYILASRNLSGPLTALGAGASDMSGWLLMALPGAAFLLGIDQIWLPIGLAIGAYFNWQFEAKRLRVYSFVANDSLTIPAYFDNRFQDTSRILRSVTAIVVLVFFTFYTAASFVAGGQLMETIFHTSYLTALIITAGVIVIYTCIGGFFAISWVDFFQGTLMFFALLIVPCVTMFHLHGLVNTFSALSSQGAHYFDAFHAAGIIGILSLLAWGLGYFGQPHIIVRFMAARKPSDIPQARFICMTWMILALYGAIFTGFAGAAYFHTTGTPLANPETVFLVLSKTLFNPWIAGILIAAVLSAVMSTSSAQLLASSSALAEDLYRGLLRRNASTRELVILARVAVVIIAAIAVWIASKPGGTILQLVSYAWAGLGASFGPVVLISLYWRRMTRNGAIAGIIVGTLTVIIWEILGKHFGGIFKLYSLMPGFILSCLAIYIVSILGRIPEASIIEQFNKMLKSL